jgi:hypothetical protein
MVRAHVNQGGEIQQSEVLVQVVLDELADAPEPRPGQASRRDALDSSTWFAPCGSMPDPARSAFIGPECSGRSLDGLTTHGSCPPSRVSLHEPCRTAAEASDARRLTTLPEVAEPRRSIVRIVPYSLYAVIRPIV